ncbi:hypothetical protein, conserved [Trypanosoma brucei gambiense DAL972]|uniref:Uncharacterized protein n=1 Tax=Trypanosoma brucei gambiense (strain MHOM/CI/86/DAL972) TaxID=679716 RepID=C9ZI49_TRYB9|nr:hypothetical protein, conserved [Trypanosoma brucei gambiense DAL972]CBH09166.1 hypothetical protein, conserved [Trypanosoma brucei gambiense DAL972]|eukprot:XP_011771607.1 hypothetical protein, conserved [Trypanosoma brucei gambiense DAL972]
MRSREVYSGSQPIEEYHSPSSPSISSSGDPCREPISPLGDRTLIMALDGMLHASRKDGGFEGVLRYDDLRQLLARLGLTWETDRIDDCWYDIVRGHAAPVADDMSWVRHCVCEHLYGECAGISTTELLSEQRTLSPRDEFCNLAELNAISAWRTPAKEKRDRTQAVAPSKFTLRAKTVVKGGAGSEGMSPKREAQPQRQRSPPRSATSPQLLFDEAVCSRGISPRQGICFTSPTMSSMRRGRATAVMSRHRSGLSTDSFPRRRSPSPSSHGDVFHRLTEDAHSRRNRQLAVAAAAVEAQSAPQTGGTVSTSPARSRRPSPGGRGMWERPTKSYQAKFSGEPPPFDPLESQPATPPVTRHKPPGPSSFVPTGYVEAVARLRKYASSRPHYQDFMSSLRSEPVTSHVVDDTPILRLPVRGGARQFSGKVVDVRLATPTRSRSNDVLRDVPYDDPSRVIYQNMLRGRRCA